MTPEIAWSILKGVVMGIVIVAGVKYIGSGK